MNQHSLTEPYRTMVTILTHPMIGMVFNPNTNKGKSVERMKHVLSLLDEKGIDILSSTDRSNLFESHHEEVNCNPGAEPRPAPVFLSNQYEAIIDIVKALSPLR